MSPTETCGHAGVSASREHLLADERQARGKGRETEGFEEYGDDKRASQAWVV
jgi:hypothetical protein